MPSPESDAAVRLYISVSVIFTLLRNEPDR